MAAGLRGSGCHGPPGSAPASASSSEESLRPDTRCRAARGRNHSLPKLIPLQFVVVVEDFQDGGHGTAQIKTKYNLSHRVLNEM